MNFGRSSATRKRWYKNGRAKAVDQSRNARVIVLRHYSNNQIPRCSCCGIDVFEFLGVDHIFGRTSGSILDRLHGPALYIKLIKLNFPEGFQILCHNCNQAKGLYGKCPHEEMRKLDEMVKELYQLAASS